MLSWDWGRAENEANSTAFLSQAPKTRTCPGSESAPSPANTAHLLLPQLELELCPKTPHLPRAFVRRAC